jgi:hypothetical protein
MTGDLHRDHPEEHAHRTLITERYAKDQAVERAISGRAAGDDEIWYPVAPQTISWPRVFPQL